MYRSALAAVAALLLALAVATPASAAPRVAALTPFTANLVAELGVRPVAIGQTLGGHDRVSPRLRGVRVLGLSHPNGPNLEELARTNPQIVLSAPIWRRGHAAMRRLKMRVIESDPRSVGDAVAQARRIGSVLGRSRAGRALAVRIRREVRVARRGIRKRPTVLLVLGIGRANRVMLANSWGGDVVRQAGGRLVTAGLRNSSGFATISDETIVRRNPQVIIVVPHGAARDIPRLSRYLKSKPAWRGTRAARGGRIYISNGNSLLQPWTDVGRTIRDVRRTYLKN